jgi:tetratricopeptide (TPR) repeat protein
LENARRNHKKALAIAPNFNPALIGLALVEAQMKNYPAANAAIEQAINIEPDRAISYIYQAEIRLLQDNRQGADQALTKAKQLAPSYDTAITNLSGLLAW